MGQDNKLSPF